MTVDVAGAQPNKESMAETGIKRLKESLSIHVAKNSNFTSDRVKDLVVVCDAAPECPLELSMLASLRWAWHKRTRLREPNATATRMHQLMTGHGVAGNGNATAYRWPTDVVSGHFARTQSLVFQANTPLKHCVSGVRRPGITLCSTASTGANAISPTVPRVLTTIACSPSSSASPVYEIQTTSKNNTYYPKCNT